MDCISWIALFQPILLSALYFSVRSVLDNKQIREGAGIAGDTQWHDLEEQLIDASKMYLAVNKRLDVLEGTLAEVVDSTAKLLEETEGNYVNSENEKLAQGERKDSPTLVALACLALLQLILAIYMWILWSKYLKLQHDIRALAASLTNNDKPKT